MAKAPNTPEATNAPPPASPAVTQTSIGGYTVFNDFELPERTSGRPAAGKENPLRLALANMPLNAGILIRPDKPADTIVGDDERTKAWKENAKDKAKAVSGVMRNLSKDGKLAYESRTMLGDPKNGDGLGVTWCVGVKRVVPTPKATPVTLPSSSPQTEVPPPVPGVLAPGVPAQVAA